MGVNGYQKPSILLSAGISSLRALRLERVKRVGGEYVTTISIITAKALI